MLVAVLELMDGVHDEIISLGFADGVQLLGKRGQLVGVGSVVADHVLHQRNQLLLGGRGRMAVVMGVGMVVVVQMLVVMIVVMSVRMLMRMVVMMLMNVLVLVGMGVRSAVSMSMGMLMVVGVGMLVIVNVVVLVVMGMGHGNLLLYML